MAVSERAEEKLVGFTPNLVINQPSHYCPGCHYGLLTRILAEVIEELGIAGDIIGVSAVGCSIFTHVYIDIDFIDALHGRRPKWPAVSKPRTSARKSFLPFKETATWPPSAWATLSTPSPAASI